MNEINAMKVANYLLSLSKPNTQESITNLKLQKLLYYVQGFHLAITKKSLFEENIEAWAHGPVVPEVYRKFKEYRYNDIKQNVEDDFSELTSTQEKIIKEVWEIFKSYDGKELENLTHSEAPWINARNGVSEYSSSNEIISRDSIKDYFTNEYMM